MSEQKTMSEQNRVLSRNLAVPLTSEEIDLVSGGDNEISPMRTSHMDGTYTFDAKR